MLPDYTNYAYVKITGTPSGWTAPDGVDYWNRYRGASVSDGHCYGADGAELIGTNGTLATNSNQQVQTDIIACTDASGNYIIPIKNENAEAYFYYKDGSNNTVTYCFVFTAKQVRLAALTDNTASTLGGVVYIGGGAANNDNGTVTDTTRRGKPSTCRALGNISKALVGSSIFMMPALENSDMSVDKTLFSFIADHGGTIYVLSDTECSGVYANETDG
ncbi:MAG: hypothetical protein IJP94_03590, partial [Clostridia bacterium]|nr:hypothetical protein [Clostridia bacterium]